MEAAVLPEEILSLICAELGRERDFHTLFNCALSARSLADPALRTLYQYHELSPAFLQLDEDVRQKGDTLKDKFTNLDQYFRKWTILWRSIIVSSVGDTPTTYKPYCRYLRILDFRNLVDMFENNSFNYNPQMRRIFFAKPLRQFNHTKQEGQRQVVDVVPTINQVGETVVPKATLLEEISGFLQPGFLSRWVAMTPRLRNMVLFSGEALSTAAGKAIAEHCENFDALTIRGWFTPDADDVFTSFLDDLPENTLRYFELISGGSIGRKSFEAFSRHKSLKELKLGGLDREAMENLNGLKSCTEIEKLELEDTTRSVMLESSNNDVFLDVVAWLSACTKLRDITIKNFVDGPSILARVASSPDVRWTRLALEGYTVRYHSSASFHTALREQKDIESLWLKGNGEDAAPHDLMIVVDSICSLRHLKELVLKDVSDEFDEVHISNLALHLPKLEEFWTSGSEVTSDLLLALLTPKHLKSLTLLALTQFDSASIIDFLGNLDPEKQKGFNLSLMAVDTEYMLSDEEQEVIREFIRTRLKGRFEYEPWRLEEHDYSDDD